MGECKAICTLMQNQVENDARHDFLMNQALYRKLERNLMYSMICTIPDICFAIGRLLQYMERPPKSLWMFVEQCFRYIAGTKSMNMVFNNSAAYEVCPARTSDSDWAGCKGGRKSNTGYLYTYAGGAASWGCKSSQSLQSLQKNLTTLHSGPWPNRAPGSAKCLHLQSTAWITMSSRLICTTTDPSNWLKLSQLK